MWTSARRYWLTGAIVLLGAGCGWGQQYSFEHYGLASGLSNLTVRGIAQDRDGLLWLATSNGAFRFDGHRFQRFGTDLGLPEDAVQMVLAARDGEVYAATGSGIAALRLGRYEVLADEDGRTPACGGTGCLHETKGGLVLAATSRGLLRLEGGRLRAVAGTEGLALRSVFADADGTIWATSMRTLYRGRLEHGVQARLEAVGAEMGLPLEEWGAPVRDGAGRLWIRSRKGLYVLERGAGAFRREGLVFPPVGQLNELTVDETGALWVAAFNGLWQRTEEGGRAEWVRYGSGNGLRADAVSVIFRDRLGRPWIGLESHGLARWNGYRTWRGWRVSDGLSNDSVTSFARDAGGRMWVGTKDGLNEWRADGTFRRWDTRAGLAANEVRVMAAAENGDVWVGSGNGGLTRIGADGRTGRFGAGDGLRNDRIVSLLAERNGELWVGTRAGLYTADWRRGRPVFERFETPLDGTGKSVYRVVRARDGALWVANSAGLSRWKEGRWRTYGPTDGLRAGVVFLTERAAGDFWIGYTGVRGGARLTVARDGRVVDVKPFGRGSGLESDNLSFLETDRGGEVWVGTDVGVAVWRRGKWRHIGPRDGLIWHDVMLGGFFAHPDGRILIGTTSGFSERRPHAPPVYTTEAILVSVVNGGRAMEAAWEGEVTLRAPDLRVDFSNSRLSPAARYRYRLTPAGGSAGPEEGWIETAAPSVFFNMAPGRHRLQVQTTLTPSVYRDRIATLYLHMPPPWQERLLFRLALGAAGVGLVYVMWRRRLAGVERQRAELERAVETRTRELWTQAGRIAEQKAKIEQLLLHAHQANRLKGEFLANMSHEIRTPMNGVIGMLSLALSTEMTAEQRDYVETARGSARSLLQILNDILDFSKIEAGRLDIEATPVSLRELVRETARPFVPLLAAKGLGFQVAVSPELGDLYRGDPIRLRQILNNLLGNAMKFTSAGEVALRVEAGPEHTAEAPELHFAVSDTGIGIPASQLPVIFEKFRQADGSVTRRFGGTGLGLSISLRLANLMGGRMWAESEEGRGTTVHFTVRLERHEGAVAEAAAAETQAVRPLRVLLVEDNAVSRRLAQRLLEKQGHRVTAVSDGREAVALFEGERFDLILMDVQMPELDGLTATRMIRRIEANRGGRTPVLMLTANAMKGDREICLEAGADGYLTKPIEIGQLMTMIAGLTEKAPVN